MTARKKLPIGIQSFKKIRSDDYYYVDKTTLILDLVRGGEHYFLSRPRRFGKSLFLDTIKELFEANEALFQGLAIHSHWDWSVKYPVLRFSFAGETFTSHAQLLTSLSAQLTHWEDTFHIERQFDHASGRLATILRTLYAKTGNRVVVLVDEYDKPILDAFDYPEVARANRDTLRGFYSNVKEYDAYIRFSFLTGVSKFSKVSIFSGLNNLMDITLDKRYSSICGYTDDDVDTVFGAELEGLDRKELRSWYNGYNWLGEGVYNPFDILQCFDKREFNNYWFETGTPTFLVNLLTQRQVPTIKLNNLFSSSSMLSNFDIDDMVTEAALFQTGYLTIKKQERLGGQVFYTLGYPNQEVYQSLNESLLSRLVQSPSQQSSNTGRLYQLLLTNNFDELKQLFQSFFASIPYHWYSSNDIQNYEGYYASVFYSYFASLGLRVTVEDCTNLGRIDMTLHFNQQIYIFEFKVVELTPKGEALQQIKDKQYAQKYQHLKQPIYLIGVEFSKEERNILEFEVEQAAVPD